LDQLPLCEHYIIKNKFTSSKLEILLKKILAPEVTKNANFKEDN